MRIGVGSDHAGRVLRELIVKDLRGKGHEVREDGPTNDESVDYPLVATRIARAVSRAELDRGILVCGSGIGMSIAANRQRGVRAALCTHETMSRLARAHNDANVLCLGERIVGSALALAIVEAFVGTAFEGGRHSRRVEQLDQKNDPET